VTMLDDQNLPCQYNASPENTTILKWLVCVQIIPCALLAAIAHPGTNHPLVFRVRIP